MGKWGAPTLDVWVVRKEFAKAHPEVVQAFVDSTLAAQRDYLANPDGWLAKPDNLAKLSALSGVPEADVPGLVRGNTYLSASQQSAELGKLVNQTIIDTSRFLKEQGKVRSAGSDYRDYVTDRFVKAQPH
ncbi:hypothetical protein [Aeromonas enteropelogenes]|uniref:hypothetical protein n=1 Tax=Aeromonas enteropelogenes TaxID=29489 RepID=UPI003BA139ED